VVIAKTVKMMNGPFARDVVRNNDIASGHIFQHRRDDIICVNVSKERLESLHRRVGARVPFTSLQVTHTVLHHEGVPCAHASNNARCNIVFRRFSVYLVDCMEIGAAAGYLNGNERREPP
jgi:hypothetical protein